MKVIVETKACLVCHKTSKMEVDATNLLEWERGKLIQQAFPHLSNEERELLLTGTHPACWKKIFGSSKGNRNK